MKVKIAYSEKKEVNDIVNDIKEQIGEFDAKLIQFYASPTINGTTLSSEMYKAFNNTSTIGSTTSGEIISGKMLSDSIVVMAIGSEIIDDLKIEVLENINNKDNKIVDEAFNSFENYFGVKAEKFDTKKYVGLALVDGLSLQEERIYERIGDITNITFVGGSAGDNFKFKGTYVYVNGKVYSNSAVLTILKCNTKFIILKTQSFAEVGHKVKITDVDEGNRVVNSINGKDAKTTYLDMLGKKEEDLPNILPKYALGLKIDENDFLVRSPVMVQGNSIIFACSVKKDMEFELIESQDIIERTKLDLANALKNINNPSAILMFNCVYRFAELKLKNQIAEYGNIFKDIPTVGFNSYGECYIGHVNQTAVMLIFE